MAKSSNEEESSKEEGCSLNIHNGVGSIKKNPIKVMNHSLSFIVQKFGLKNRGCQKRFFKEKLRNNKNKENAKYCKEKKTRDRFTKCCTVRTVRGKKVNTTN